jgi:catechol 2,3-dioxygenase-like lactoylglutathione lyase family enzyme
MKLNQVTLPVTDMVAATDFYRRMGFLQIVDSPPSARFESQGGDATFSLDLSTSGPPNATVIYFEHEALDELVQELKTRGFVFAQEPRDMDWLWREAVLYDPSNNKIKLYWAGKNRLHPPWRVERSLEG